MAMKNFDPIVEKAKSSGKKNRVVIAGADSENILLGAFQAQDAGFATPILVGDKDKITSMVEKLGLSGKPHVIVPTRENDDVTQEAIKIINQGGGDILMRGNIQTREFLLPLLDKQNNLRTSKHLTQIDLVSLPEYDKLIAIGDVTVTIDPDYNQKKEIIENMAGLLGVLGYEKPNLALLSLVEEVSFHMKDTVEASELVREHSRKPIANCNLVGPIAYDLILSKEAARLKGYENPLCGEFDGIVAPQLLAANLIVKCWQMHAEAKTCGVIIGANIPVALTSRSDNPEVSFLSLAVCSALPPR